MEEEKEGEAGKNKRWFDECLWACGAFAKITENERDTETPLSCRSRREAALQTVSHLVT